jgi:hypothetical protein
MNVRRVILISGAMVLGVVALAVLVAFLAPGLLLDLMEANSSRRRVAHCQTVQIASVIRAHYLQQEHLLSRDEIASRLVEKQAFRSCGQDPYAARDALQDPWGEEFCLLQRSPSAMVVFSKNYGVRSGISAAVIDNGVFRWEDVERGSSCR